MILNKISFLWLLICVHIISTQTVFEETDPAPLCLKNSTENGESIINCSCFSDNDTIIIQDTVITYGNDTINLDNSTTDWRLFNCSEVHLSGLTLPSLGNLRTLELHNINEIHIDTNFFSHYSTQFQALEIYNSNFSTFGASINIQAKKFRRIILDNINLDELFSLLIHTDEDHTLDLIAIKNCKIKMLGEINISSRSVHQFLMENNTIGSVASSAILQKSNTTTILGNTFEDLNLLSMDITAWNFTLRENTFKVFIKSGIQVHNATFVQITGNVFSYIKQYSFIYIRPKLNDGSLTFTQNQFYDYELGSLQFDHTVYNRHLHIKLNAIHTTTCNCNAMQIFDNMTEAHNKTVKDFHKHRFMTYELLRETSACVDENGVEKSAMTLCNGMNSDPTRSWVPVAISITAFITVTALIALIVQRKQKCIKKDDWPLRNKKAIPYDYSVNFGYMDDSENEEYVRK